jgi:6-phosphogluconolactonase (cycloisomerase 2 family)
MKCCTNVQRTALAVAAIGMFCATLCAAEPHYLITNNDNSQGNTATFYSIADHSLSRAVAVISTGGTGNDGLGSVATKRVSILSKGTENCAFISDAGSNDVAAIAIGTLTLSGTFPASSTDSGASAGVGIVNNGSYLYANFTTSKTLATYKISSGCQLTFLGDTPASGLSGGAIVDMWAHGNILVASFQDGSIGSFNISGGTPVANGDLQLSNGNVQDGSFPAGVDITADGHYAVFGGTNSPELVEVSDISSGKLMPTAVYSNIGSGSGSEAIWLSPNETLLYISNFSSSQVTGARFDVVTGAVTTGCISSPLKGNSFEAGLATANTFGTGGTLFVAEPETLIGIVEVGGSGGNCTLTESPRSPAHDTNTITVESIGVFPPRPF